MIPITIYHLASGKYLDHIPSEPRMRYACPDCGGVCRYPLDAAHVVCASCGEKWAPTAGPGEPIRLVRYEPCPDCGEPAHGGALCAACSADQAAMARAHGEVGL